MSHLTGPLVFEFVRNETQDGRGLIDAHFVRRTAHIHRLMTTSYRNEIRIIAKNKGLASDLE